MRLKELRETTNLNQTEIAKELGIPRINYNKYELNTVEPSIETLCKIADYYGVSLDYLCEHKSNQLQLGYLSQEQKDLIKLIISLNQINLIKAYSYVAGLYAAQE